MELKMENIKTSDIMISIIVPCYNSEKTLHRCVSSLCNQTDSGIEIILVDDGSSDKTPQLCDEYARMDSRIKVVHQANKGLVNARQTGVKATAGQYVAFCDSDDYLELDFVENIKKVILDYNADIIIFGRKTEYENGTCQLSQDYLLKGYYDYDYMRMHILPCLFSDGTMESRSIIPNVWTKVYKREKLINIADDMNEKVCLGEDWILNFAYILNANSLFCMGTYYPYHYLRNSQSMVGKYDSTRFLQYLLFRETLLKIAEKYKYAYKEQIEEAFLGEMLVSVKKEICRNPEGYKEVKSNLSQIRENDVLKNALKVCSMNKYSIAEKVFAKLFVKRMYFVLYVCTKVLSWCGMGVQ